MARENEVLDSAEMAQDLRERYADAEAAPEPRFADFSPAPEEVTRRLAKAVVPRAMEIAGVRMTPSTAAYLVGYGISSDYLARLLEQGEDHAVETLAQELGQLFGLLSFNGIVTTAIIERGAKSNNCPRPYTGLC